ncbi:hypothetical protein ABZ816_10340 [Actinosynnema sp. NPDC047251]|uniref:hypothetical protein n=1 Tax=Saccharothrix espanaensis TaxID=103731 RepID=UPI0011DD5D81|nr:hypothetical protein [Saccharothrix espanaensis]
MTSATGVVINLATDQISNPWTWGAVVLLTVAGVFVGLAAQRSEGSAPPGDVHNTVSGSIQGNVVQARTLGSVSLNTGIMRASPTIEQSATAYDGSNVHQAGRDIRHEIHRDARDEMDRDVRESRRDARDARDDRRL